MLRQAAALVIFVLIFGAGRLPAASQDDRTFVDVSLNGVDKGQAVVVLADDDVLMLAKNLEEYGIPFAHAKHRSIGNDDFVSLGSLKPKVLFDVNMQTFELKLTVAPDQFGTHEVTLAPQNGTQGDPHPSAFLNYAGTFDSSGDAGISGQIGLHRNNAVFSTGGSLQTGNISSRGQTFLAFDDVPHMNRIQIGDSIVAGDSLVGGAILLGLTSSRQFALDPYAYIFPQPSIVGSIPTAGTAQIYINGGLTQTVALQPGVFDLSQLPVQTGQNQVAVVVRDAQGIVQTFGQSYFAVNSLLRKGLTDYQYGAGFVENANGFTYERNPSATASYRIGATDEVTYGAHFAGNNALQSGDLSADLKLGAGALHLAVAGSSGSSSGSAYDLETYLSGARNSVGAGATVRTPGYATIGEAPPPGAPPDFSAHLSLSQQLTSRISLSLLGMRETYAASTLQPSQDTLALNLSGNVGRASTATISLQQSRTIGQAVQNSVYVSFIQSFGKRSSFTTTATAASGANPSGSFEYRLDPPSSNQGFGYSLQYGAGSLGSQAHVIDHERFADLDGGIVQTGNGALAFGNVAGGVVSTGGYTLPSRPIGGGFAVVSVGQPEVQVLLNNSPVGLTDRNGMLVVPTLTAYAYNAVSIDRSALPLGAEIEVDRISASSSYLGGTLASLTVRQITYVSGRVRVASKGTLLIPAYGVMMVGPAGRGRRSALDGEGYFYFEDLAPGRYPATVMYAGGRCTLELTVKPANGIGTDLGEVRCTR